MLVQPVITAGLSHFLLGERLGPRQSLGGVAMLAGVKLVHRDRAQEWIQVCLYLELPVFVM